MKVRALRDSIIFKFVDGTKNGMFASKHNLGIIISSDDIDNQSRPRWGVVEATGPDVGPEISVGTYILVDALKWTQGLQLGSTSDTKIWQTTYEHVSAISEVEINQF